MTTIERDIHLAWAVIPWCAVTEHGGGLAKPDERDDIAAPTTVRLV